MCASALARAAAAAIISFPVAQASDVIHRAAAFGAPCDAAFGAACGAALEVNLGAAVDAAFGAAFGTACGAAWLSNF